MAKSFVYKRRAFYTFDIFAIFLMGSSGTIAYSHSSDFDVWICHRPDLSEKELAELKDKAAAIEQWAAGTRVEVHFHFINPQTFKSGNRAELSQESSGSALHHLLLDEFYLTGILVAGRYPLWWLVPPHKEYDYDNYTAELIHKRFVRVGEFIDLGGIRQIPAEEFFGASLWQLSKGIDSPYKSALKIALMEVYASEYPCIDLLSRRYKEAVHDGIYHLDLLDSYVMLYKKVGEYLQDGAESERLELIRRCFYLKVHEPLSKPVRGRYSWRRELMAELVKRWRWSHGHLVALDSRRDWKINRVMEERRMLIELLTSSYQFLSNFAREQAALSMINQADLNVLGRKLYSAFERKAGKIEMINWADSPQVRENHITIVEVKSREQDNWLLFRDALTMDRVESTQPLKRGHSVAELVVWSYVNRILARDTAINLLVQENRLTVRDLTAMVDDLRHHLPWRLIQKTTFAAYATSPIVTAASLFVNLGVEPMQKLSFQGKYLISSKTDPLCYGGQKETLVRSIDMIIVTSWREMYAFRFLGVDGLMECLLEYLRWGRQIDYVAPPSPSAHSYNTGYGSIIVKRLEELFQSVIACFFHASEGIPTNYIVAAEQGYYVLHMTNDAPCCDHISSMQALMTHLGASRELFTQHVVDDYALIDSVLPVLLPTNKKGVVQLYYATTGDRIVEIYVLDERGSLFYQATHFYQKEALLKQISFFFNALYRRSHYLAHGPSSQGLFSHVEFYRIYKKETRYKVALEHPPVADVTEVPYFNVQVLAEKINNIPVFTIYCEDTEFSSTQYGELVFEQVAKYIQEHRSRKTKYPQYITDLDISPAILGADNIGKLQTIHFLKYKREVEEQLNSAMRRIGMDVLAG